MKKPGAVELIQPMQVKFTGAFVEELKARFSLYETVKNACWSSSHTGKNVFNHQGEDWLGERVVFHAAEDFSEAVLMMLEDNDSTRDLARKLNNIWPPDVADTFVPDTGILDVSPLC